MGRTTARALTRLGRPPSRGRPRPDQALVASAPTGPGEVAREFGIEVLGMLFDCISKEVGWVKDRVVAWIGANSEDRAGMMFSGLDPKHWFKIVRNSVCFGGGRLPHGGFLVPNVEVLDVLGVREDCVVIKDVFSDLKVRKVFDALPEFPRLLSEGGRPLHEVMGTFMVFYVPLLVETCLQARSASFTRSERCYVLFFCLVFASGWTMNSLTRTNSLLCIFPVAMALAKTAAGHHRWGTLMLEFFFGLLRVHQNSDQLSVQGMLHVVQNIQALHKHCQAKGFLLGRAANTYTATWTAYATHAKSAARLGDTIEDPELLAIFNDAAASARALLLKCGWAEAALPALSRKRFQTWAEFKTAFAEAVKADISEEDAREHDGYHPSSQAVRARPKNIENLAKVFDDLKTDVVTSTNVEDRVDDLVAGLAADAKGVDEAPDASDFAPPVGSDHDAEMIGPMFRRALQKTDLGAILSSSSAVASLCLKQLPNAGSGVAGRRTIFERIALSSRTPVPSQEDHCYLDVAVYSLEGKHFGRVLLPFKLHGQKYIVDLVSQESEKKRLADLQRISNQSSKVAYELVSPSSKHASAAGAAWDLVAAKTGGRVRIAFASSLYFIPGTCLFPMDMYKDFGKATGTLELLTCNLAKLLTAECKRGFADGQDGGRVAQRRATAILAVLDILHRHADEMTSVVFKTSGLAAPLKELQAVPDISESVKQLVAKYKVVQNNNMW